jgi:xylan 1,4-beta-xylosidase
MKPSDIDLRIDWNHTGTELRHSWAGLLNIDQFRWMVRKDVQEQLAMAHREIGGRHVRAVGMFDDEMRVMGRDPTKTGNSAAHAIQRPNFQVMAYVIDSLLDVGVNPMFTTCFMPGVMASGERTTFTTRSRISPPSDPMKWQELVTTAVRFCLERYGPDRVRSWYFEVWNEPNLQNGFFEGTRQQFFELWKQTFDAIKAADPELRVGGPSTARGEWLADLIEFGRQNRCEPDFLITHIYNNDSESNPLSPFDGPQEDKQSKSPHFAAGVIRGARRLMDQLSYAGEIHWNEWGRSWLPFFPDRETSNEAAFIVKTMSEVADQADRFAYWCLSDIYDQAGYGAEAFHGNYGMLSLQSLRKPNYHVHQLLCRLGDRRLPVENTAAEERRFAGAIASDSKAGSPAVLAYCYDLGEPDQSPRRLRVNLPRRIGRSVRITKLDRETNNVVAMWNDRGSPAYLSRQLTNELQRQNVLSSTVEQLPADRTAEDVTVDVTLHGSGVVLIEGVQ